MGPIGNMSDTQEQIPDAKTSDAGSDKAVDEQKPRATKTRTKTGCITCRKRRIKCTEEKPACNQCIKSRRHCEGYQRLIFREPAFQYQSTPYGAPPMSFHGGPVQAHASQYLAPIQSQHTGGSWHQQVPPHDQLPTHQYVPGPVTYQDIQIGAKRSHGNPYADFPLQLISNDTQKVKRLIHDRESESRGSSTTAIRYQEYFSNQAYHNYG